ncbi:hypothetical protein OOZ63_01220 [Paucibacter sp. PLA-PC-4]|uniref:hypothetical protein n=1 Tax=Paucibacter sp. PLA-PC-4 TaxID=2993655 RepID=UPI0022489367|nr:hypothetical protein [Paucibacter sp. PLA-PC-4]MCX2860460.1 hypothetical protein [Paucibacter sp. PLA-PC-4]
MTYPHFSQRENFAFAMLRRSSVFSRESSKSLIHWAFADLRGNAFCRAALRRPAAAAGLLINSPQSYPQKQAFGGKRIEIMNLEPVPQPDSILGRE